MPMPVCKNLTTVFDSTDDLINQNDYLGDASEGDWIYSGYIDTYDDALLVAMPNQTSGTVISSTHQVWYGKIKATLKSSHLAGVVTAFILFSNAQDEIDFEFIGSDLTTTQSNYYYEAILNNTNVRNGTTTNTFENYHTYEVDWKEDELTWSIDGEAFRTLKKEDTYNETTGEYYYPQTPSRVQVSIWPGGDADNSAGTIAWAGGAIDWDSDDIKDYGYYYMLLKNITIECYDPPSRALIDGDFSYVYNSSDSFTQDDIMITDDDTVLGSDEATGLDPDEGKESSSSSSSSSTDDDSSTATSKTSSSTSTSGSSDDDSDDDDDSSSTSTTSTASGGFVQFGATSSSSDSNSSSNGGAISSVANSILSVIASFCMVVAAF